MTKLTKKQETHKRIVTASSHAFRRSGFAGIGVDGIAKEAGVTSGAFYAHLGSKGGAFEAALSVGLDEVIAAIPTFQINYGDRWIEEFSRYYLGEEHRNDLACGCAMTTLSPEVVRSKPELHQLFEVKMLTIVTLMAEGFKGSSLDVCISRAWVVISILIGGLTLTRAVNSHETADMIATSVILSAIEAAGETKARRE